MALVRRWEGLSCGPAGSAQVDSFISDLEGVKEQLESIRGMPLTDVECRSRLYSGLPVEGKEYLDSLSLESVSTYADMLKETRRWAQLDIRYHYGTATTPGIGSRGTSGKAPSKSFAGKGAGNAKTNGNKTAQVAELYNVESVKINENLDDSVDHGVKDSSVLSTARSVFLTGLPRNWSWSQIKELVSKLLGHVVEVFVTLLSSPGASVLRFNNHDDAVKFMEACQGSRLNGRQLRCHFDKFERPVDEPSTVLLQTTAESVDNEVDNEDDDVQLSTDNSELECQATVLDCSDSNRLIPNAKEFRFDDQVKQSSIRSLTVSSSGLPHLRVSLGHIGYEAEALVDTGASDVFIAKDLVDILRQEGEDLVICNCDIGVNMVNGTNCAVLGIIYDVPVTITTELVRHVDCYVLDKPRYEFILPKKVLNGCIWVMSSENGSNDILLSGPSAQYISNVYDYFADDKVDCIEALVGTVNNDNVIPERLEVDIPWKSDARPSSNYKSALSRSRRLIARLLKDKQSYEAYESAVNELLSANVVEVCNGEDPSTFATYYMNVVPVVNHSRTSTKCRLCLDARFINGYMFNCPPDDSTDSMNLWRTLMKWRSFYRVSAEDLRKAFWQVCVGERDQRFLGLLLPLKDRVLAVKWVRVPFGTRFSPWALSYAIRESLFVDGGELPVDYYVDDLIIFGNNIESVERSRAIVEERLAKRGFSVNQLKRTHNLLVRGEAIGEPRLLSQVTEAHLGSWLGYRWFIDANADVVDVKIPDLGISDNGGLSLDILRSVTAKLYDPLGLMSEVTLQLRCMMKHLYNGEHAALGISSAIRKDGDDDLVPVIPSNELQEELVERVHLCYGHPGISRMVKLVRQFGWFKGLYCAIKKYVLQCPVCAQAKEGKMLSKAMSTVKNFIPMIWGVVGLDLFGPIRLQNQSKCWVLIAVCYITRLVAIRVVASSSAADVIAGFVEIITQEGIPKIVVHDQGQCFMATSFKDVLARYHIVQAYANSYDAAQRGWIERCHAEFGALLRSTKLEVKDAMKDMNDVRRWCSLACFTMNCLPYSDAEDSRLSPWLCCRASRGLTDCILGEEPDMVEQVQEWLGSGLLFQDLTDNIKRVADDCQEEWARSLNHLKELWLERRAEVRRKLSHRRRPLNDQLKIGDTVWKRNYAADKLNALFTGPYIVTDINGGNIGLRDSAGTMSTATVNQLKKGLPPSKKRVKAFH